MLTLKPIFFVSHWWLVLAVASIGLSACQPQQQQQQQTDVSTSPPQTLSIAAAANLAEVLPTIIDNYCEDKGLSDCPVTAAYSSSGKLYAQIIAGAPYDLYLAANQSYPHKLMTEKPDSMGKHQPFTYARGQLSLYSTTQVIDANSNNLDLLQNPNFKIAIANPELAPYGEAAQVYLTKLNLYDSLSRDKQLVMAENIGQAFQFTNTGHADIGFVALSQVKSQIKGSQSKVDDDKQNDDSQAVNLLDNYQVIDPNMYPAILQDGLVITDNTLAEDFASYLQSEKVQHDFTQAGYLAVNTK